MKTNNFKIRIVFIIALGVLFLLALPPVFAEKQTIWLKDPNTILSEFRKSHKLEKDSDGWYWFFGKKYKAIEQIFEESLANITSIQMVEKTKAGVKFESFATYTSITTMEIKGDNFSVLRLPGGGSGGEIGTPELPYYGQLIAVPRDTEVELVIDRVRIEPIRGEYKIFPGQPPLLSKEDSKKPEFIIDEKAYKKDRYIGEDKVVCITEDIIIRGRRFVYVIYRPILYNPAQNKLKAAWEVKWSLKYRYGTASSLSNEKPWENEMVNSIERMTVDARPELGALPKQTGQGYQVSSGQSGADYLIIVHDNFYEQVLPLAEWKTKKGYKVCVTKLSEINSSGSPTAIEITDYIKNAYTTWNPPPLYVLLVGDSQFLPPHYKDLNNNSIPASDIYYAAIDGVDIFPDLFIGRLPSATTQEAETMVNKILLMERAPPTTSSYYQNALVAGYFESWVNNELQPSIETCEAIKDYLEYRGWNIKTSYVSDYTYGQPRKHTASLLHLRDSYYDETQEYLSEADAASRISDTINNGVCLAQHLDHGSSSRWVHPNFTVNDIRSLTNADKFAWVNSMNCSSGKFDAVTVIEGNTVPFDCVAEVFLKNNSGGAYAVIAATDEGAFAWQDLLAHGIYECIWPDYFLTLGTFPGYLQVVDGNGIPGDSDDQSLNYPGNNIGNGTHLGQILNFAKVFMFDYTNNPQTNKEMFERFHLFGCPEQEPRLVLPQVLSVNCPASLGLNQEANFDVLVTASAQPLANARVSLILDNEFYMGITNEQGMVHFEFTPAHIGEMTITVSHRDSLPFEGFISIADTTPPTTPLVTDSGQFTNNATQLTCSFSASDPESGIAEYQYKITQDSTTGTVIRDWTSAGTDTSVTATGLSLTSGKTYYFGVKVKNGAQLWSGAGYSDGIQYILPLHWSSYLSNSSNQAVYAQGVAHSGSKSLKLVNSVSGQSEWYGDTISFTAPYPKTLNLSGWVKGQNITSGSLVAIDYYIEFEDGTYVYYYPNSRFPTGSYNWKNKSETKTFTKGIKYVRPYLLFYYGTGTVWYDDISVTRNDQWVSNSNAEQGTTSPSNWTTYNNDLTNQTGWVTGTSVSPAHSLRINNTKNKNASWGGTSVTFSQPYPTYLMAGGYSRAQNVVLRSGGVYGLSFYITFADGSSTWYTPANLRFSTGTHDWQYRPVAISFTKGIKAIQPYCLLYNGKGYVWFDNIFAVTTSPNLVPNPGVEQGQ